ncbi:membrane protein, partial [Streptomyces sp. RSD-27]
SDGMTDEYIRLTYGRPDSFALAEELYDRVPRSFPEPDALPDPWKVSLTACLLRGLIFALPGLAYLLGAPLLEGPPDRLGLPAGTLTLLAGALIGWVWDQTLSHRAYTWLGLGDRASAGRTLLVGAPVGALLGTAAAFAVPGGPPFSYAFAAGQALYVGAATVLLVLGRERLLLAALGPMAAGSALALFTDPPVPVRVTLLLVSLAAACTLALRELP